MDNAILQSFLAVAQDQVNKLNQAAWGLYQQRFADWVTASAAGVPPPAPQLEELDQRKLASLFMSWTNAGAPTGPDPVPIATCITMVDATPLQPPQPPAASTGKLGPLLAPGQWAKLANDPAQVGDPITVAGVTYVLKGVPSPFGWFGVHWEVK